MNIQLLSDLHLESNPTFMPQAATGADVLVLAGDIGSYQAGSALALAGDADFGLARFSPRHGWPSPVLFVPGNHEYDGLDFDEAHSRLQETCARLGITWLEREVVQMGSVRFVGTTLWTDFDALGPLAGQPIPDPLQCQDWLRHALNTPFDGSTVVVTHFAPSLHSADPRYGRVPGTAGFCNALDALLPQAQLWLHGHLHCPSDYSLQGCRVVANPLGYAHKHEQRTFKATALISL